MSGGRLAARGAARARPRASRLLLLGLVAGLCASCRRRPVEPIAPEELMRALLERGARAVLFDGTVSVRGESGGERLRGRAFLIAEPGGRLYLEGASEAAFVVACDGREVTVLLPRDELWLRAPASARTLEALVGLPIRPEELGALVAGAGVTPEELRRGRPAPGEGRLYVEGGYLDLGPQGLRGGRLGQLRFAYASQGKQLDLEVPERRLRLELKLQDEAGARSEPRPLAFFRPRAPARLRQAALEDFAWPILFPAP